MELFDHSRRSMEELLASDEYSPEELASLLDMPVNVIRTACHRGDLQCRIVDHDIVSIRRDAALEWLQNRE